MQSAGTFQIGDCTVFPALDEIRRDGVATKVEPRAMRVLVCLAERPGQVVSVQELLDQVWKDVVVTPDSVYTAISALRRVFGDDGRESRYIVNVPRRGYRLVASVSTPPAGPDPDASEPGDERPTTAQRANAAPAARQSPPHLWIAAGLVAVAAVAATLVITGPWQGRRAEPAPQTARVGAETSADKSIAILPFVDASAQHDKGELASGTAEGLHVLLSKIPHFRAIGPASTQEVGRRQPDARAAGVALGVSYVVTGKVQAYGDRIRILAQLVNVRTGALDWSDHFDRQSRDLLEVQDQIVAGIARALEVTVNAGDLLGSFRTRNPDAYAAYLSGLLAYDRQHADSLAEAQGHFERAVALDPTFLRAAEALALTHVAQGVGETVMSRNAWQQARAAAKVALKIDPNSAAAHAVLGLVAGLNDFEWDRAEQELQMAMALDPQNPTIFDFAAQIAQVRGDADLAMQRIGRALALDPLNPYALEDLGFILWGLGELHEARRVWSKRVEVSPQSDGSHYYLAQIAIRLGEPDVALREAEAEFDEAASKQAALAIVYHAMSRPAEATAALKRVVDCCAEGWPTGIAAVYASWGRRDKVLEWLERAYECRDQEWMMLIRADSLVGNLRSDPRYRALLRKMKLPN